MSSCSAVAFATPLKNGATVSGSYSHGVPETARLSATDRLQRLLSGQFGLFAPAGDKVSEGHRSGKIFSPSRKKDLTRDRQWGSRLPFVKQPHSENLPGLIASSS